MILRADLKRTARPVALGNKRVWGASQVFGATYHLSQGGKGSFKEKSRAGIWWIFEYFPGVCLQLVCCNEASGKVLTRRTLKRGPHFWTGSLLHFDFRKICFFDPCDLLDGPFFSYFSGSMFRPQGRGACFLDVGTLTFCQLMGFPY